MAVRLVSVIGVLLLVTLLDAKSFQTEDFLQKLASKLAASETRRPPRPPADCPETPSVLPGDVRGVFKGFPLIRNKVIAEIRNLLSVVRLVHTTVESLTSDRTLSQPLVAPTCANVADLIYALASSTDAPNPQDLLNSLPANRTTILECLQDTSKEDLDVLMLNLQMFLRSQAKPQAKDLEDSPIDTAGTTADTTDTNNVLGGQNADNAAQATAILDNILTTLDTASNLDTVEFPNTHQLQQLDIDVRLQIVALVLRRLIRQLGLQTTIQTPEQGTIAARSSLKTLMNLVDVVSSPDARLTSGEMLGSSDDLLVSGETSDSGDKPRPPNGPNNLGSGNQPGPGNKPGPHLLGNNPNNLRRISAYGEAPEEKSKPGDQPGSGELPGSGDPYGSGDKPRPPHRPNKPNNLGSGLPDSGDLARKRKPESNVPTKVTEAKRELVASMVDELQKLGKRIH